jgi:hypothetical protein
MFTFKFNSNSAEINRKMSNLIGSQMPFAVKKSLNDTARTLLAKNKQDMKLTFDNPVPFTLNAFFIKFAKKYENTVTIRRKDVQAGKHYLEVQGDGGARPRKAIENKFKHTVAFAGPLEYMTPTKNAPRLKNGNVGMGFVNKVLSQVQSQTDAAKRMNEQRPRTRKSKAKQYFFPSINHPLGQGKRAGIYERTSAGNARKVFNFLPYAPTYRPRFHFHDNMNKYAKQVFPKKFRNAMRHAMATAKLF